MASPLPLLPHQAAALARLRRFSAGRGRAGLVIAPTGAGKSRVAAVWLAERARDHGERVLWLAHRESLLQQASGELGKALGQPVPRVRGQHLASASSRVVVSSVGSLRTALRSVTTWASRGPSWVVLDEAHHAPAHSFRTVLDAARAGGSRIVGLTATPTRTTRGERPILSRLFDHRVIARVELQPLVERSILARASLVRLSTHAQADADVTDHELRRLARTGDLSPSWLRRLAALAPRNRAVVEHIAANRTRYGPTIVFAHDVLHAALLARQLAARGLRADYATAERPDGSERPITQVIERFNLGALDVIVGVAALDEGVDLVRARTVVLARPTSSEIRLRQCIGRVLRGPALGGDPVAYVVLVEDDWGRVAAFHGAIDLVQDLFQVEERALSSKRSARTREIEGPSFDALARASEALAGTPRDESVEEAAPVARMVVRVRSATRVIPISSAQLPGWRSLREAIARMTTLELRRAPAEALHARYFPAVAGVPAPPPDDVAALLQAARLTGLLPLVEPLSAIVTPYDLAVRIRDEDLGERARTKLLQQAFIATHPPLYASLADLRAAVDAVLTQLTSPAA